MEEKTIISITHYGKTYSVEINHCELKSHEMIDETLGLIVAAGWDKENVDNDIIELAESLKSE